MPTYAKIKTDAVTLNPVAGSTISDNNSIFVDSSNSNTFTNKTDSGTPVPVQSDSSLIKKQMQSGQALVIHALTPIAKLPNGKIVSADTDSINGQTWVGIALEELSGMDSMGLVQLVGTNVPGVLTGLGFAPGDEIYLNEGGGYINDVTGFTGNNDSIIRLGIADCPAGVASSSATDLILFSEVVARP